MGEPVCPDDGAHLRAWRRPDLGQPLFLICPACHRHFQPTETGIIEVPAGHSAIVVSLIWASACRIVASAGAVDQLVVSYSINVSRKLKTEEKSAVSSSAPARRRSATCIASGTGLSI